ncbi:uncharacterized protein [Physcomitrium patens]|uniref:uncharacterized protein isoform X2 n=1 Tax=Physcomitrium patens TaxID=3218 RepID=UPI000D154B70|nr:uncharacterized protein LOC112292403 isoform X2 [Physcomitrium patens]|eukprot:XP_024396609.1 uncharacterized protein LOC112292403 isoform X2 [Physcomitrella patens]
MASIRRLDTTSLSNSDGGLLGVGGSSSRSSKASLEKSKSFREGRECQQVSNNAFGGGPSHHGDRPALSTVLNIDSISLSDAKSTRQLELRRVINAAAGSQTQDFTLGKLQSKPLESCSAEDVKRVRSGLEENAQRSRERTGHFAETVNKLDRFLQTRKRSRPGSSVNGRVLSQVPAQRPRPSPISAKTGHRAISSNVDTNPSPKEIDATENGLINKKMRTSLSDSRLEGRSGNLNLQRPTGAKDWERETPRPSSSLMSPSKRREKTAVASPGGWENSKPLKGRRSVISKPETSAVSVANGFFDGQRKLKGNAQQYRYSVENRPRPSEGHAFRSGGPVNGITSMQKVHSSSQGHGSGVRGSKLDFNGGIHPAQKDDRNFPNAKASSKLTSREEDGAAIPIVTTKAKGARAPRSNLVGVVHQSTTSSRSSCLTEGHDVKSSQASVKSQTPSENASSKRLELFQSSSPPVASWGTSKKMARVTRRVNPPPSASVLSKEETSGVVEVATSSRDGSKTASSPTSRSFPCTLAGSNLSKRAGPSSTQSHLQSKVGNDRLNISLGPPNSEDSVGDGQRLKEVKKKEEKIKERKDASPIQRMGILSATDKNTNATVEEQIGGGDGVRRQERTGRGSVIPSPLSLSSPAKNLEDVTVDAKPTKYTRSTLDAKPVGPGRPTKKNTDLRKSLTKPRRVVGNGLAKMSGGDKDDSEHLMKAVQQAVGFSANACKNDLWRQLEPYFAYVTSDDLAFLHEQMDGSQVSRTNKQTQFSDTSLNSDITDIDGTALMSCLNSEELSKVSTDFRMDVCVASSDKTIPLSQRLLSAIIDVDEATCVQQVGDDAFQSHGFGSGLPSVDCNGSTYETRDPEGESACDGMRTNGSCFGATERAHWENPSSCGSQHRVYDKEKQLSSSELSDWGEQYRQMSLDDRLWTELRSIGLYPEQTPDSSVEEEDEISEEITRLRSLLSEEVCLNKERISKLENAVLASRNAEDRAREQLAMNLLVEMAYKKRMGGRCIKGAAAKGARAAALLFAKRVLAKVQRFDTGHSCISGSLQKLLFRVSPDVGAPTSVTTAEEENEACVLGTVTDRNISYPDPLLKSAGNSTSRRFEGSERISVDGLLSCKDSDNYKSENWPLRAKEREALVEDLDRPIGIRGLNSLSINDLGGHDWDGKDDQGKEMRITGAGKEGKNFKSGLGNIKGERKTKTRPRQKTGSLLKSSKNSIPKPHSHDNSMKRPFSSGFTTPREEVGQTLEVLEESQNDSEGMIDLSGLALPGMEDMTPANLGGPQDFASFLDFEDPLLQTDDFLQGLDCPMDDLNGLTML